MDLNAWRRTKPGVEPGQRLFEIHTANMSGWGPVKRYLAGLGGGVFMVLVQEHKLFVEALPEAQAWLRANAWDGLFIPAVRGPGGGVEHLAAVRSWSGTLLGLQRYRTAP